MAISPGGGAAGEAGTARGLPDAGPPTLKTISRLTGLAVPTVSRALNDAPDIGEATKARVRAVAAELGYVPNRAGLRLRTGRTNVLSLVLSTEHDMMNHTARLISSLAGELQETPYHLNVTPFFPTDDPLRAIRHIVEMGLADAVIFNQTQPRDPRVAWLMERGFPFATHGRTDWADRHAWFDFDNEAFGRIAVGRLARAGRRRIAVVAPPLHQSYAGHVVRGVTAAGHAHGVEVRILADVTSDDTGPDVRAALDALLARGFDGVVCASPAAAMAAALAIEARGLRLGRDADLFAKEAIPFLASFRPGIMAIREDVGRAGRMLARAAIRAVREPGASPLQELDVPQDETEESIP